ncbi:hypothetical protein T484DRAFT_1869988 [Baffinella frigidus]|nr:hypothetical protein T484DRAFT_1869988 [Cryptophyta sp. CCMP2293]
MHQGVYEHLNTGDRIPGSVGDGWWTIVPSWWGFEEQSPVDKKLSEKQKSESNKEEEVDNAREQRKVLDNAAEKATEKAAKAEAKKRKNFGDMDGVKAARVAEKLANEKIAMAEAVKVVERAAKADKLSALAAIAVNNLAETPSKMQSTGIPNPGCTCFFNVLLQVLFSMPYVLSNILQMDNSKHDDIITALQNVFLEMSDTSKGAMVEQETLETFFRRFGGFNNEEDTFNIYAQETPVEAAMKLIERCEKAAVNRGLEGAGAKWFRNISYVKCETTKTNCQTGEVRVVRGDGMPFLPITRPTMGGSVQKDLTKQLQAELVKKDLVFKWAPKDATEEETAKIPDLPHKVAYELDSITKNLVVDIHRSTGFLEKTEGGYSFSRKLDLFKRKYNLQSVVVHDGTTIQSGHYIAFKIVGGTWWKYDDKHVTESTWDQVMDYGFGGRPGSTASMLVYGKTVSAP